MNRQIAISALSIVMALGLTVGGTLAYFTDTATSSENSFTAGTLIVDINQDDQPSIDPVISNLAPGQETTVLFDVENNGTLPVNLRGFAIGNWTGIESPDNELMQVTKVEYWNGSSWVTIATAPEGFSGYFHYSPDGTDTALFALAAGDHEDFRLTVKLDETATDEYQGGNYDATITVEAKQVDAPWE